MSHAHILKSEQYNHFNPGVIGFITEKIIGVKTCHLRNVRQGRSQTKFQEEATFPSSSQKRGSGVLSPDFYLELCITFSENDNKLIGS